MRTLQVTNHIWTLNHLTEKIDSNCQILFDWLEDKPGRTLQSANVWQLFEGARDSEYVSNITFDVGSPCNTDVILTSIHIKQH